MTASARWSTFVPERSPARHVDEERRADPQRHERHLASSPLLGPQHLQTQPGRVPLDEPLRVGRDEDDMVGPDNLHAPHGPTSTTAVASTAGSTSAARARAPGKTGSRRARPPEGCGAPTAREHRREHVAAGPCAREPGLDKLDHRRGAGAPTAREPGRSPATRPLRTGRRARPPEGCGGADCARAPQGARPQRGPVRREPGLDKLDHRGVRGAPTVRERPSTTSTRRR